SPAYSAQDIGVSNTFTAESPGRPSFVRCQIHAEVLDRLGLVPLLALGMRLGEGSGAGMAMGLLKGALACHRDMATFEQAGVSDKGHSGSGE
ncbi:hypothetical protein FV219_22195, partial [Methylobacterium sp. WL122]